MVCSKFNDEIQPQNYWCRFCNSKLFKKNFDNWTSGNQEIDELIRKCQLSSNNKEQILEWIPYNKFANIERLAEGGFGKIYKAKWVDGPIKHWNIKENKWEREINVFNYNNVALKVFNNSQSIKVDFLKEVAFHKLFDNDNIVRCYGISQDPKTGNYAMVMDYICEGDLRKYLQNNRLRFYDKLNKLYWISSGLKEIHRRGLIHRDLHPGNVLNKKTGILANSISCYITDLGLCRPVNEVNNNKKVYGVLPYVAPEILCGNPYTQASDIYSFGMIGYEVLSGLSPYFNIPHNNDLTLKICQGLRPKFDIEKCPPLLVDLINRCWDANPSKRPTAIELFNNLTDWREEIINYKASTEFYQQYQEAEEFNKVVFLTDDKTKLLSAAKTHPQAIYTSRLLDSKNLPQPQNNHSQEWQDSTLLCLQISSNQEAEFQSQIEVPPKNNN